MVLKYFILFLQEIVCHTFLQELLYFILMLINLTSIIILKMEHHSPLTQGEEQQQVTLINQLCRLEYQYPKVQKTIILYDLFETPQKDQHYLHNMHTVAQVLVDHQAKVEVQIIKISKNNSFQKLTLRSSKCKIKKNPFEVEAAKQGQDIPLSNIFIYEKQGQTKEKQGQTKRVVVIPIQKDLTDISQLKREQDELEKENIAKDESFRKSNFQGQNLKKAQAQWAAQKKRKFQESCEKAKVIHLKMFKIQAFIDAVLQKTQTYSICSLVQIGRKKEVSKCLEEFKNIFKVSQGHPQIIYYNCDPQDPYIEERHEYVTTRLQTLGQVFKVGKIDCWENEYFYRPLNVRSQIYQNMQQANNNAVSKVIQDFVQSWNNITLRSASCIATVVKLVNSILNQQKKLANQNLDSSGTDLNASLTEIPNIVTFPQIFSKYISKNLWFPKKDQYKLSEFYTDERLCKKITIENAYAKIPSSIECLVFISFFYKLVAEFAQHYKKVQTSSKNDQIILLKQWKTHLKELYELTSSINKTLLNNSENKGEYMAQDMQKFFNFLMFTLDSSEKIKKITGREIATSTSLKSLFEQFRPRRDRLLSYIIANQRGIKPDEPVQYYDLYLLVLKQNASQDIQNDLQYIELHIHQYRAYRIATQYIWDNEKLVQAIRSYSLICLKFQKLNENKRKLIKILDIERRQARLLKIVGQEECAAEIYFKNRQIFFANNCCKQVLAKCKGDDKADILIRWGEKFEKQFEYDLANNYYLMAYSYARSPAQKRRALQNKMKLLQRRNRLPDETERARHDKFLNEPATEQSLKEFCSQLSLKDMHKKLYKYLEWDSMLNCSGFSKLNHGNNSLNQSMMGDSPTKQPQKDR